MDSQEQNIVNSVTEVIGFDLGHGDTAVAKMSMDGNSNPKILEIHGQRKQCSVVGKKSNGDTVIGDEALTSGDVNKLDVYFKQKITKEVTLAEAENFKHFIREYSRLLNEKSQIEGGTSSYFIVGCPSGWTLEEREKYQRLLKIKDISHLKVVPESRAAFINYRDEKLGKEYKVITALLSTVLVIDIGSSTTDFTLVEDLEQKPSDFGENKLGASLIDRSIYKLTIEKSRRRQELEDFLKNQPYTEAKCLLSCRQAKEEYFSKEKNYQKSPQERVKKCDLELDEDTDLYFKPVVSYDSMQKILDEHQDELDGKGWREAFETRLQEIKKDLDKENKKIAILLLTGGASRMEFTRKICEQIFPGAKFQPDLEPEYAIATGLARLGRWELLAEGFKQEVKKFISEGGVKTIVRNEIPNLIDKIANFLSEGIIDEVVKVRLKEWQQGDLRLFKDVESTLERDIPEWLRSNHTKERIKEICQEWLEQPKILEKLHEETKPICNKYHIKEEEALNLQVNIDPDVKSPPLNIRDIMSSVDINKSVDSIVSVISFIIVLMISVILGAIFYIFALIIYAFFTFLLFVLKIDTDKLKKAIIMNFNVPVWARKKVISEETIKIECDKQKPEITAIIKKEMNNKADMLETIVEEIGNNLEKALSDRADQATILIR